MPKRKRVDDAKSQIKHGTSTEANATSKGSITYEISVEGKKAIACERHGSVKSKVDLIFTHGAGGGLEAPAMQDFAAGFTKTSNMIMFQGNANLKSRVSSFQRVIAHEDYHPALGGRSMGARAACLAAQESKGKVNALVLASFPLVGASKGDSREDVLLGLPEDIDVLFISGDQDTMCDLQHLRTVIAKMKARSWLVEITGADHGTAIKPKAATQPTLVRTGELTAEWLSNRDGSKRYLNLRWDAEERQVVSGGWHELVDGASAPLAEKASKRRKKTN